MNRWSATMNVAILGILGLGGNCLGQTTSLHNQPTKRSQGFLEFALGKINPRNEDYGTAAANAREDIVDATIREPYFWSNVLSLTLLGVTSASLIFVLRTREKREIITSRLIAQLWNGKVVDRHEIVQRTAMYNALVEEKNATLNRPKASGEEPGAQLPSNDPTSFISAKEKPAKQSRVPMETGESKAPTSPTPRTETTGLPPLSWEEKARLLDGQNQALRNTERNLKQRLNQVSQDLEQERRRNQTLKGA